MGVVVKTDVVSVSSSFLVGFRLDSYGEDSEFYYGCKKWSLSLGRTRTDSVRGYGVLVMDEGPEFQESEKSRGPNEVKRELTLRKRV